jgi:hypothetical protein
MLFAQRTRPVQSLETVVSQLGTPTPIHGGTAFYVPDDHELRLAVMYRFAGEAKFIKSSNGVATRLETTGDAALVLTILKQHEADRGEARYQWKQGVVGLPRGYRVDPDVIYSQVKPHSMRLVQGEKPVLFVRVNDQKSGFANVMEQQFPGAVADTTHFSNQNTAYSLTRSEGTTYKLTGDEAVKFVLGYADHKEQVRSRGGVVSV